MQARLYRAGQSVLCRPGCTVQPRGHGRAKNKFVYYNYLGVKRIYRIPNPSNPRRIRTNLLGFEFAFSNLSIPIKE